MKCNFISRLTFYGTISKSKMHLKLQIIFKNDIYFFALKIQV
jgi:hypothetical protein